VPVFSAAQLSRAVESRQDKRPQLSDLRESGCLTGDTLIYLPDEGRFAPIESLVGQAGFGVTSLNPDTLKLERAEASAAFCTGVKPVYRLTTRLGRTIRATGNHPFYTFEGWQRLDALAVGQPIAVPLVWQDVPALAIAGMDALDQPDEAETAHWDTVISITPDGEAPVYDLTVPRLHNFVADGIIVHNSIEQDADVVMFLYRDVVYNQATEFPNQADVIVAKHRNGRTDTVSLYFDGSLTKFMDGAVRRVSLTEDR
nr:replicative DNA helicase [Anaerolineae bacterium]